MTPLKRILDKLDDPKRAGDGHIAKCPAHKDTRASLSITEGEDHRVLLRCHAGCTTDSIVQAMGLKLKDLYDDVFLTWQAAVEIYERRLGRHSVAYHYLKADGVLVNVVARWNQAGGKKETRPVSLNCRGWILKALPSPRPIYNLREIQGRPGDPLYWVEGEKCAEAMKSKLGFLATTTAGGAKAAGKSDLSPAAAYVTILIPDRDRAGQQYVRDVAAGIFAASADAKLKIINLCDTWPELPKGGDIADVLDAGEAVESVKQKLQGLVDTAKWLEPGDYQIVGSKKADTAPGTDTQDVPRDSDAPARPDATQAGLLVELVKGATLFHDGDTPYATIEVSGHTETHPINSTHFRRYLSALYYRQCASPANATAIADALGVLSGMALFDGEERKVYVRLAGHEGTVFVDLCDVGWRVVEITAAGWRIIAAAEAPVRFTRKKGMLPLPEPTRGGSILDLRPLLNAEDDDAWILIIAWVVGAFRASGPYCIMVFEAEQGAGKSTLAEFLRQLIDPNEANLRAAPRDERDLVIAATNSRVLSFDNLSGLSASLSDALCRLATGGGFSTRTLYSNDEETIFNVARPALLNGIDELAARPDLLERAAVVKLPSVSETGRRSKLDLETEFQRVRPGVLGALLDAVSVALKNESSIKPAKLFRMADFQKWVMAAEPALPWKAGQFVDAYQRNRNEANSVAAESSAIGPAVIALIESRMEWSGTAADLVGLLDSDAFTAHKTRNRVDWPKSPRAMANALRRIAPSLRALGVTVAIGPGIREAHTGRRIIHIEKSGIASSPSSPESPGEAKNPRHATENRNSAGDDARKSASSPSSPIVTIASPDASSPDPGASSPYRHPSSPENVAGALEMQNGDEGDDGDARKLALVESRERGEL